MTTGGHNAPRVSVLLPVRNGDRFLDETMQSIFEQTLPTWELIVVLNGSTDDSREILRAYSDPRVRIEEVEEAIGLASALNLGLALCRAPYVARIDADDLCAPERFERQVAALECRPEVGVLGTAAKVINASSSIVGAQPVVTGSERVARRMMWRNALIHPSVMLRRSVVERVGAYNPGVQGVEDYELWLRLLGVTEIDNLPEQLLSYRRHTEQVSLRPLLERRVLRSLNAARLVAAPRLGISSAGARLRGVPYAAATVRWEFGRRARLRRLAKTDR